MEHQDNLQHHNQIAVIISQEAVIPDHKAPEAEQAAL
jgi:hypothetical protein